MKLCIDNKKLKIKLSQHFPQNYDNGDGRRPNKCLIYKYLLSKSPWIQSTTKLKLFRQTVLLFFSLFTLLCWTNCCWAVESQLSWTPIYVDTTNQLDLWTIKDKGCGCPNDTHSKSCACCAKPGGCQCSSHPSRCAQCGLEESCQRFCNVSISSWNVATKSGLTWIQLKSPVLQGPTSCWWRLESEPGERIEVQIHRLISVGSFDNNTQKCTGGFVQFADGDILTPSSQAVQLCAENSRFSPPVVIFADKGIATLLLRIAGKTTRSQLLAYISFSSTDDPVVGDVSKGGRLQPHSVCDMVYDNCWRSNDCILTSPGFPGLAPASRSCRYFLFGNSTTTNRIRLIFHTLSFPKPYQCTTHYLSIWKSNSSSSTTTSSTTSHLGTPWKILCEEIESVLDIDGASSAILEFHSGPAAIPPFIHNGFRATVQFLHVEATIPPPPPLSPPNSGQEPPYHMILDNKSKDKPNNHVADGKGFPRVKVASTTIQTPVTTTMSTFKSNTRPPPRFFTTTTTTTTQASSSPRRRFDEIETPMGNQRSSYEPEAGVYPITCGHIFEGELTRGSVFRLLIPKDISLHIPQQQRSSNMNFGTYQQQHKKGLNPKQVLSGPFKCQIEFRGRPTDIVQFAAFNYKFRGTNCSTVMEIYDMVSPSEITITGSMGSSSSSSSSINQTDRLLGKLCGPTGNHNEQVQRYISSHSRLALVALIFPNDELLPGGGGHEFLEGAFRFHDESIEGTVKPMSNCEVVYYGVASSPIGSIVGPPESPLLKHVSNFPLICGYTFIPGFNQSITLSLVRAGHESSLSTSTSYCRTICSGSGCSCESKYTPLSQIDHLLIISSSSGGGVGPSTIACLCGYFKDFLPLTFESHVPLTLVHHSATRIGHEFSYSAGFEFKNKTLCSNFTIHPPSSSKRWKEILDPNIQYYTTNNNNNGQNLHYTYLQCTWSVSVPVRYKLVLHFISEENEDDCRTWNLTIWTTSTQPSSDNIDNDHESITYSNNNVVLFSFCPKQGRKVFEMPERTENAVIKLTGVTLRPPQFEIRWKYIDIMLGSGFLTERKLTNDATDSPIFVLNVNLATSLLIILFIVHKSMFFIPS